MARITLDIQSDFSAITRAESHMDQLNHQAVDLSRNMRNSFQGAAASANNFDQAVQRSSNEVRNLNRETERNSRFSTAFTDQQKRVNELKEAYRNLALAGRENGTVARGMREE